MKLPQYFHKERERGREREGGGGRGREKERGGRGREREREREGGRGEREGGTAVQFTTENITLQRAAVPGEIRSFGTGGLWSSPLNQLP